MALANGMWTDSARTPIVRAAVKGRRLRRRVSVCPFPWSPPLIFYSKIMFKIYDLLHATDLLKIVRIDICSISVLNVDADIIP